MKVEPLSPGANEIGINVDGRLAVEGQSVSWDCGCWRIGAQHVGCRVHWGHGITDAHAVAFTELKGFPFDWGDTRLLIAHGEYLILIWHGRHISSAKNRNRLSQVTYNFLREITIKFINVHRKR